MISRVAVLKSGITFTRAAPLLCVALEAHRSRSWICVKILGRNGDEWRATSDLLGLLDEDSRQCPHLRWAKGWILTVTEKRTSLPENPLRRAITSIFRYQSNIMNKGDGAEE